MIQAPLSCPKCKTVIESGAINQPELQPCPSCRTPLRAEIFPAFFRRTATGHEGELVMEEGEATCFYHPAKKAVRPCEGCGRFVCALCDCELRGQHFCPTCLEIGKKKGKIKNLESRRTLYDSIALTVAVVSFLFLTISIITAPIVIYLSIRYWNAPRSPTHRTRARFIFALIIATLQIIWWVVIVYFIVNARHSDG